MRVPVAFEVARALDAPLDVIVVRKLGVPHSPELGMGAIGEGGARVINTDVLAHARVSDEQLRTVEERERAALDAYQSTGTPRDADRARLHDSLTAAATTSDSPVSGWCQCFANTARPEAPIKPIRSGFIILVSFCLGICEYDRIKWS